jgi:hypothetical protein
MALSKVEPVFVAPAEPMTGRVVVQRSCWYMAWTQGTLFGLLLVTWPLWWGPERVRAPFPQVPFWSLFVGLPLWLDRMAVGLLLVVIAWQCAGWSYLAIRAGRRTDIAQRWVQRWLSGLLILFLVLLVGLVLVNQHRLQPWVYLAWWISLNGLWVTGFAQGSPNGWQTAQRFWRWLVISVYFFSAISKLDYTFLRTLGGLFLSTLWAMLPGVEPMAPDAWPVAWLMIFPLGELLLAGGLAVGRFPRTFVGLAVFMHLLLLLILGPWGLNQQPGVWIWNLFFIGQVGWLFWPMRETTPVSDDPSSHRSGGIGFALLYLPLGLPLLQPFGACDHWLAWELYAPRGSRVQIFLAAPLVEPASEWSEFLAPDSSPEHGWVWHELRIDQWSLRQLHAPLYPEDRFQLGVALSVAQRVAEPEWVLVQWHGPADRWTGRRETKLLRNSLELERFSQRFLFNVRPRSQP